jgi:hypothetical protein
LICGTCSKNIEASYNTKKLFRQSWNTLKKLRPTEIRLTEEVLMEIDPENSESSPGKILKIIPEAIPEMENSNQLEHTPKEKLKKLKIYRCPYCERQYKKSKELKFHLENRFSCSICQIDFCDKISYRSHKKYHKEMEKKFACGICNLKFKFNSSLKKHIQEHEKTIRMLEPKFEHKRRRLSIDYVKLANKNINNKKKFTEEDNVD